MILLAARRVGASSHARPADAAHLSASINPLGVSACVLGAIRDAVQAIARHPDPRASALVGALSTYRGISGHGISGSRVIPGNGSTELLCLVARAAAPRRALSVHPAFIE